MISTQVSYQLYHFEGNYMWNTHTNLSVRASFTWVGSLEALVFGYIKGESVSTNNISNGIDPDSSNFLTPVSDLSLQR